MTAMSPRTHIRTRLVAMFLAVLAVLCAGNIAQAVMPPSHEDCAAGACELQIGCRPEVSAQPPVPVHALVVVLSAGDEAVRPDASLGIAIAATFTLPPDRSVHRLAPRAPPASL